MKSGIFGIIRFDGELDFAFVCVSADKQIFNNEDFHFARGGPIQLVKDNFLGQQVDMIHI